MCGIAGILALGRDHRRVDGNELDRLGAALAARGPDGQGAWIDTAGRIGLAHRRLAIIAPGPEGGQPMVSADGRLCISFNGEIYNHHDLRAELQSEGAVFRTTSDTEVLLHLYDRYGAALVERLEGMYAFALWDAARQGLLLARDPFGIKPLYLSEGRGMLRFASQVKALAASTGTGRGEGDGPDPAGVAGFLLLGYVPEPHTLHRSVRALPAGTALWADADGVSRPQAHFCPRQTLLAAAPAEVGEAERRARLRAAAAGSVRRHLVADVPVGLFLSAGVDSGTLLALARAEAGPGMPALTLAFEEYRGTGDDEAPIAERVATVCEARSETHWATGAAFRADAERVLAAMDQPSTDGVNTWLVSQAAARRGLKVALSGVGGDELLGGYPGFRQIPRLAAALRPFGRVPGLGRAVRAVSAPALGRLTSPKYAGVLEYGTTVPDAWLLRRALFMPWELPAVIDPALARAGWEALDLRGRLAATVQGVDAPHLQVMLLELSWYMRSQLLRDADWAGMAHGVEIRTPLVDRALFRGLAPLIRAARPPDKADLLAAAGPAVSAVLAGRPKTGFTVPVRRWLMEGGEAVAVERGGRGWARHLLARLPGASDWLVPAMTPGRG
ncbi:asparagine synthase (glutamine-hydrolyzing) [Azospirillum sp.]|uniref:asparagine synthase (glutamine-hydrolyzing) n=1 Tax=Azospirillum sp. TaxID=34012 RepID=UPI003D718C9F